MKKITFRADTLLIEKARAAARAENRTLNDAFRYTCGKGDAEVHRALMRRLRHIKANGPYTRDELNER